MKISFIGLGKLGLPLACCLAEAGNEILAIDNNTETIKNILYGFSGIFFTIQTPVIAPM